MNPRWFPATRDKKLARLLEEAGEVIVELGKIQRFGLDTRYSHKLGRPDASAESNREALLRELKDLKHAIAAVEEDLG